MGTALQGRNLLPLERISSLKSSPLWYGKKDDTTLGEFA